MFCSSARKPDGGFQFISAFQLCMIWWAYRQRLIRLIDLRVWFAAHELLARRCQLKRGQTTVYTCEEVQQLVGGGGGISSSLQRLRAHDLLTWKSGTISFPASIPCGKDWSGLEGMLAQVPNSYRRVPVPRRLLRFIAGSGGRVVTATILGHLLRCLYYRKGQCKPEGFCKASWIAKVFGVSLRNVKAARQYLKRIGLLHLTEIPQWLRNRYGQKMTINLHWVPPSPQAPAQHALVESPPPSELSAPELAPPDSHTELPTGLKHQEPTTGGPTGILHILFQQAREAMRNGTAPLNESEPVVRLPLSAPPQRNQPQVAQKRGTSLPNPTLNHILQEDLADTGRLLQLYTQAAQAGLIGMSEADRLGFAGLAQHVLVYGPGNPGGLFRELLSHRSFHFITQAEEDAALQRLKHHLYGKGPSVPIKSTASGHFSTG